MERHRRRARRPRRILGLGARLTLLGLSVVVLILATIGLVAKAIRPYHEGSLQTRDLAQTKRQIAALDTENAVIRQRIAYLKTPEGIVTEARQAGYLKPGEVPFIVESMADTSGGQNLALPSASTPSAPLSRIHRLWNGLTGH